VVAVLAHQEKQGCQSRTSQLDRQRPEATLYDQPPCSYEQASGELLVSVGDSGQACMHVHQGDRLILLDYPERLISDHEFADARKEACLSVKRSSRHVMRIESVKDVGKETGLLAAQSNETNTLLRWRLCV
jgi:hypothetical protein